MHSQQQQRGLSLISTLIVGIFIAAVLILGLKLVPVYTEFFGVKKAFSSVIRDTDVQSPASTFRNNFMKYAQIDDITSVDPQTIVVTKDNGRASMSVDYRKEIALFANVSLVFDFSVSSDK